MKYLPVFAFLLLATLAWGCGSADTSQAPDPGKKPPAPTPPPRPNFPTGQVIDDPAGFSLYLPAAYAPDRPWPAVFFFDAHARAQLPLRNYQPLAESMGWVMVASSRSQNGQQAMQSIDIATNMIREAQQKLNLDSRRMYLAGFSGGARVAALVAQNRADIAGVIACGAGFQPAPSDRFHFAGMVGMEDFNYQEMRSLDHFLAQNGSSYLMEYFDGGHDWAPLNTFAKGLQWLHFRAMAEGSVPQNDTAATNMLEKVRYQDQQLISKGSDYQRWLLRRKAISYLDGLSDVSALRSEMEALANSKGYQAELSRQEAELQREMEMRKVYSQALEGEGIDYWKRVAGMMAKVGRNGSREDAWLNKRVLNFLSLSAYMNANAMLKAGALPAADRMVQIYALVDPPNAEHAYLRAILDARSGQPDAAMKSLGHALELGFSDADRLQNDLDFAPLHSRPAFSDLVGQARENKK